MGEATEPPLLSPARGPPNWDNYNQDELADENGQSIPEYEFNQWIQLSSGDRFGFKGFVLALEFAEQKFYVKFRIEKKKHAKKSERIVD